MGGGRYFPFKLKLDSGIPIYVQLKEGIKLAIATGNFAPGAQLPTVRQLAVELKINANTVSKVYSELESEGVLVTRQGKGTFVRERPEIDDNVREGVLNGIVEHFMIQASELGFTNEELLDALKKRVKENGTDDG